MEKKEKQLYSSYIEKHTRVNRMYDDKPNESPGDLFVLTQTEGEETE